MRINEGMRIEPTRQIEENPGSKATAAEEGSKSSFGSVNEQIEHAALPTGSAARGESAYYFTPPSKSAVAITVGPELPQHGDSVLKDGVQNIT